MIHHSCDRCKRLIDSQDEFRYEVRMEVRAALDTGLSGEDEADRDHLMDLHEILESNEEIDGDFGDEELFQPLRYDLCPECYRKFIRNPMGKEPVVEFNFSKN